MEVAAVQNSLAHMSMPHQHEFSFDAPKTNGKDLIANGADTIKSMSTFGCDALLCMHLCPSVSTSCLCFLFSCHLPGPSLGTSANRAVHHVPGILGGGAP